MFIFIDELLYIHFLPIFGSYKGKWTPRLGYIIAAAAQSHGITMQIIQGSPSATTGEVREQQRMEEEEMEQMEERMEVVKVTQHTYYSGATLFTYYTVCVIHSSIFIIS